MTRWITHYGWWALVLALLALVGGDVPGTRPADSRPAAERPADWAQPLERPGLPNLQRVNEHFYRGAQPEDEGFAQLKAMGVKTVVDLRAFHSDAEACQKNGLKLVAISFKSWHGEDEDMVKFLKAVNDKENWPVFVHCQHGSDRTGTACAVYRMAVEGWSKDRAIDEMTHGGYGFHPIWQNLIDYVRAMDVQKVRTAADMAGAATMPVDGGR